MADSISILKNSSKNSATNPMPVNHRDTSASGYFQKSLINSIDNFKSQDSRDSYSNASGDYTENLQNNQIASALQGINNVLSNSYNSFDNPEPQAPVRSSYDYTDKFSNEDSNVNRNNYSDKQTTVESPVDNKNKTDMTANSNQKPISEQEAVRDNSNNAVQQKSQTAKTAALKDVKAESALATKSQLKEQAVAAVAVKLNSAKAVSSVSQVASNLISLDNKTSNAVASNISKNKIIPDKILSKVQGDSLKEQAFNIKNTSINTQATKSEIKQTTAKTAQSGQEIKDVKIQNDKDFGKIFIKQNENNLKAQVTANSQNIKPDAKITIQAQNQNVQPDIAKNNIGNVQQQKVKDEIPAAIFEKLQGSNNNQSNSNSSFGNLAGNPFATTMEVGKGLDLTNSVGLTSVRLQDIAEKTLQLTKNLQNNTTAIARLLLKPPSLGTVLIEITMKDNVAQLTLRADTKEAVKGLESQISILKDKLNQDGIKTQNIKIEVRHMENDLTDNHSFSWGSNARQKEKGSNNRQFIHSFALLNELRDESSGLNNEGIDNTILTQNIF